MLASKDLSARKFNETVDVKIISILEESIVDKENSKSLSYQMLKIGRINPIATSADRKLKSEKNIMINPEVLKNIAD